MSAVTPAELARRILVAEPRVLRVLLFGSRARGDAAPDSDYDLIVIVPDDVERGRARVAMRLALRDLLVPLDLIVTTASGYESMVSAGSQWASAVVGEAMVLHEAA